MRIAVAGAGSVGKTLGRALEANGYDIAYRVLDPAKTTLRNATSIGAALAGAAVAILAVPWPAGESLVSDSALVMARRDAANRNETPRVRMMHPHPQKRSSHGYPG
jgi:predicted dinucleotide-binding enzyme